MQECRDGLDGIAKFVDKSFFLLCREVRNQRALMKRNLISPQERLFFFVERRDDRPSVDSGRIVSTCPVVYATSVPTEKVHDSMKLESVLRGYQA